MPNLEKMYDEFTAQTGVVMQAKKAYDIDKFVCDEALALFL
ncbi:MAG TPA: hypothetical protein VNI84_05335 [Pyrinomonadaceae bacterium]|nr:hypothetical protein [Pyrinomonadaceae bacterium]